MIKPLVVDIQDAATVDGDFAIRILNEAIAGFEESIRNAGHGEIQNLTKISTVHLDDARVTRVTYELEWADL